MGYAEFHSKVAKRANEILLRLLNAGEISFRLTKKKGESEVPWPVAFRGKLRREEQYVERLYVMTNEIIETYNALKAVETYLENFPFPHEKVAASTYIHSHIESYYNEMYILFGRMKSFARKLGREFRKDSKIKEIAKRIDYVDSEIDRLFKPLLELRGSHVHIKRYDDAELRRLSLLEILVPANEMMFKPLLEEARGETLQSNLDFVKTTNAGLADKLDKFFNYFAGLVFKKNGTLRFPSNIAAA